VLAKHCKEKSAYDFLLWNYLISKMFEILPADLHNLKQIIYYEIDAISPAMLHDVRGIVLSEVHQCANLD
jgi:hypothetical protein